MDIITIEDLLIEILRCFLFMIIELLRILDFKLLHESLLERTILTCLHVRKELSITDERWYVQTDRS